MKRVALSVVVCLAVAVGGCGGGSSSPTSPTPSTSTPPSASTFTLGGTVTETAPTTNVTIPGATLRIVDGPNAGKTATADANGAFQFAGLARAGFTVEATADGYVTGSKGVTLNGNLTLALALDPSPKILTSSRNETVSGGDTCVGGPSTYGDGCKQYSMDVHHAGTISGTLSWEDRDTWLWLELYRASDGQMLAQAESSRINGLHQDVSVNVPGHERYIVRIRYVLGSRITPFSSTFSRPN
jgi:hypothetical protein